MGSDGPATSASSARTRNFAVAFALVGIATVGVFVGVRRDHQAAQAPQTSPSAVASLKATPSLVVIDEVVGRIPWQHPLRLQVRDGRFDDVAVVDDQGTPVPGVVSAGQVAWTSATTLVPNTTYRITAHLAGAHGSVQSAVETVQSSASEHTLVATVTPGDNDTVGVGMPVIVTFNRDVPTSVRDGVASHLSVSSTPAVQGAWRWITQREAHWRPDAYWPAHTSVSVQANLDRVRIADDVWGSGTRTVHFTIGDSHIAVADVTAHTFTVSDNGKVLRVLPMSAGRDVFPTRGGTHIVLEKQQVVTMDSQTVGIPRNSPDGYFEKVFWDVRISYGGAFVHAAPWSVNDQGHRNVSHGCVNLSTADAQWYFGLAQRGDIVNVVHSPASPVLSDPGMIDWNAS
jgi:lipoprotein-anchoring transpeptidase ErfK/SrfK